MSQTLYDEIIRVIADLSSYEDSIRKANRMLQRETAKTSKDIDALFQGSVANPKAAADKIKAVYADIARRAKDAAASNKELLEELAKPIPERKRNAVAVPGKDGRTNYKSIFTGQFIAEKDAILQDTPEMPSVLSQITAKQRAAEMAKINKDVAAAAKKAQQDETSETDRIIAAQLAAKRAANRESIRMINEEVRSRMRIGESIDAQIAKLRELGVSESRITNLQNRSAEAAARRASTINKDVAAAAKKAQKDETSETDRIIAAQLAAKRAANRESIRMINEEVRSRMRIGESIDAQIAKLRELGVAESRIINLQNRSAEVAARRASAINKDVGAAAKKAQQDEARETDRIISAQLAATRAANRESIRMINEEVRSRMRIGESIDAQIAKLRELGVAESRIINIQNRSAEAAARRVAVENRRTQTVTARQFDRDARGSRVAAGLLGMTGNYRLAAGAYAFANMQNARGDEVRNMDPRQFSGVAQGAGLLGRNLALISPAVMNPVVLGVGALAAALATPIVIAFNANEFNKQLADMSTLLADVNESADSFRSKLNLTMNDVVTNSIMFNRSLTDTVKGFKTALSSGIESQDLGAFSRIAGTLSAAIGSDFKQTADILTTFKDTYSLTVGQLDSVNDILFNTINKGKVDVGQLITTLGRVVPIAAQAGISIEEMMGSLAGLSRSLKIEQAVVGLSSAIQDIVNPTDKAKKVLDELGVAYGTAALKAQGLQGWLQTFFAAIKDQPDLLGQVFSDDRAQRAVSTFSKTAPLIKEITSNIGQQGTAAVAADRAMNTFGSNVEKIWNTVSNTFQMIGSDLLNVLNEVFFDGTALSVDKLTELRIAIERVGQFITLMSGSLIATFKVAYEAIAGAVNLIKAVVLGTGNYIRALFKLMSGDVDGYSALVNEANGYWKDFGNNIVGASTAMTKALDAVTRSLALTEDRVQALKTAQKEESPQAVSNIEKYSKAITDAGIAALALTAKSADIKTEAEKTLSPLQQQSKAYQDHINKLKQVGDEIRKNNKLLLKETLDRHQETPTVTAAFGGRDKELATYKMWKDEDLRIAKQYGFDDLGPENMAKIVEAWRLRESGQAGAEGFNTKAPQLYDILTARKSSQNAIIQRKVESARQSRIGAIIDKEDGTNATTQSLDDKAADVLKSIERLKAVESLQKKVNRAIKGQSDEVTTVTAAVERYTDIINVNSTLVDGANQKQLLELGRINEQMSELKAAYDSINEVKNAEGTDTFAGQLSPVELEELDKMEKDVLDKMLALSQEVQQINASLQDSINQKREEAIQQEAARINKLAGHYATLASKRIQVEDQANKRIEEMRDAHRATIERIAGGRKQSELEGMSTRKRVEFQMGEMASLLSQAEQMAKIGNFEESNRLVNRAQDSYEAAKSAGGEEFAGEFAQNRKYGFDNAFGKRAQDIANQGLAGGISGATAERDKLMGRIDSRMEDIRAQPGMTAAIVEGMKALAADARFEVKQEYGDINVSVDGPDFGGLRSEIEKIATKIAVRIVESKPNGTSQTGKDTKNAPTPTGIKSTDSFDRTPSASKT